MLVGPVDGRFQTDDVHFEEEDLMSPDAPQPYGSPIALEAAKKVAAPALAEASRNNWAMAVAVVDTAGDLVYFERMDATQAGSVISGHRQGALGGTVQTPDESVSGHAGNRWRRVARVPYQRRGTCGRRRPDHHRRQDCWRDRRLRRHEPARWPMRPGRRQRDWVGCATPLNDSFQDARPRV